MKTAIRYMILLSCAFLLSNCNNDLYDTPQGTLTISSTIVKVGEPVTFTWNGDGDHIVFYSGELKHEYKYKDRKKLKGIPEISFEYRNYKNDLIWERGNFEFYYSADYTGENFETATWNNITARFNKGEGKNSYQKTGYVQMEELQGKHATFAFKGIYNGGNPVDIGWGNFKIRSYSPELETYVEILSVAKDTPGIVVRNEDGPSAHIWELNSNWRFKLPTGVTVASKKPETGWCILPTQSFEDAQYPGDEGEVKKTMSTETAPWVHIYTKPGVYSMTVVASCYDSSNDQRNELIVERQITVEEADK